VITLEAVTVAFEGTTVLGPLDLALEAGALVGLVGPPGSGKSLMLKLIAGLVSPTTGRVRVLGEDPRGPDSPARSAIGMVFQNNALFDSRTIFENVAFPLRRSAAPWSEGALAARVRERLREVGLASSEELLPHELSGGMQKRAGIARATAADPVVRLYDEPTAGLDPVTSARILTLITALHDRAPGVSIVISNEMDSMLRFVPRVLMLHRGQVVFDGPRRALDDGTAPELARRFTAGDLDTPL
jgi:phospholipid/cholesterol/gamma-HCH transport system ATP-binding protein